MKKILLAFDGKNFSKGALDFARVLNEENPILLIGAFLPHTNYASSFGSSGGGVVGPLVIPAFEDENSEAVQANIELF